jgi:hypothetical protein
MSKSNHAKLTRAKTWQLLSHLESNPQDKQVVTAIVLPNEGFDSLHPHLIYWRLK